MEMFQYDFIQRAFVAGLAMSCITPILGLLLILRRQSLMADTLSHISLAGVALGMLMQVNPSITTLIVVIIAAVMIEYLRQVYANFSEVSIAMMMSAGMAIALVLVGLNSNSANFKIEQFLFGSIILITNEEVKMLIVLAIVIFALYILFRRPLYVLSYDEDTALTSGLPVKGMSIIFSVITGVAISVMMPIVGSLLVSALIVIPSATAVKIARSFTQAIFIAFLINVVGIFAGLSASYYIDTPPGASITLSFIFIFMVITFFDWLIRLLHRKKHQNQ